MILDEIMAARKEQLAREQKRVSFAEMQQRAAQALERRTPVSLAKALRKSTLSCICEVKKSIPLQRADLSGFSSGGNCKGI